jgi:hypothetical protein
MREGEAKKESGEIFFLKMCANCSNFQLCGGKRFKHENGSTTTDRQSTNTALSKH